MSALTTEERMEFPFPHRQEAIERIVAARVAEALAPVEVVCAECRERTVLTLEPTP